MVVQQLYLFNDKLSWIKLYLSSFVRSECHANVCAMRACLSVMSFDSCSACAFPQVTCTPWKTHSWRYCTGHMRHQFAPPHPPPPPPPPPPPGLPSAYPTPPPLPTSTPGSSTSSSRATQASGITTPSLECTPLLLPAACCRPPACSARWCWPLGG